MFFKLCRTTCNRLTSKLNISYNFYCLLGCVTPCCLVDEFQRFRETCHVIFRIDTQLFLCPKFVGRMYFPTFLHIYQIPRLYIPKNLFLTNSLIAKMKRKIVGCKVMIFTRGLPFTAEACVIFIGASGTGTDSSPSTAVFHRHYYSVDARYTCHLSPTLSSFNMDCVLT